MLGNSKNKMRLGILILAAILALIGITYAGGTMDYKTDSGGLKISYKLENAFLPYKYIQIEVSGIGEGLLTYRPYKNYLAEGEEEEKAVAFQLDEKRLKELVELYKKVNFLELKLKEADTEKLKITDVGLTTITYDDAAKHNKVSYSYLENNPLEGLVRFYWQIIDEYMPKPAEGYDR